jgi:predicted DNA-binding transcriptional regulator AlpA
MEQQLYYVPDLARLLGTTEAAIRNHVQRRAFNAIPQFAKRGRRVVWRKKDVEKWMEELK